MPMRVPVRPPAASAPVRTGLDRVGAQVSACDHAADGREIYLCGLAKEPSLRRMLIVSFEACRNDAVSVAHVRPATEGLY